MGLRVDSSCCRWINRRPATYSSVALFNTHVGHKSQQFQPYMAAGAERDGVSLVTICRHDAPCHLVKHGTPPPFGSSVCLHLLGGSSWTPHARFVGENYHTGAPACGFRRNNGHRGRDSPTARPPAGQCNGPREHHALRRGRKAGAVSRVSARTFKARTNKLWWGG